MLDDMHPEMASEELTSSHQMIVDQDRTPSSICDSPEADVVEPESKDETAPPQKRKGGRKPIYATSEERKQRNRQAQAAFRERRTEYIKQLEATIKQNETSLAALQQSHRSAADECLMLRYKNSLLERILLEKGIDVQAELQIKAGSPIFPNPVMPGAQHAGSIARAPLQRAAIQRHHARRSASIMTSAIDQSAVIGHDMTAASPVVTTPSSHISSPSSMSIRSPVAAQNAFSSPVDSSAAHINIRSQPQTTSVPQPNLSHRSVVAATASNRPRLQHGTTARAPSITSESQAFVSPLSERSSHPHRGLMSTPLTTPSQDGMLDADLAQNASNYYPSPFQKHIDQLEHEYDAQHASQSMLDRYDDTVEKGNVQSHRGMQSAGLLHSASEPDPRLRQYDDQVFFNQQQLTPHSQHEQPQMSPVRALTSSGTVAAQHHGYLINPEDPSLDADPFGLTASMQYSTSYSFEPEPRRT